MRVSDLIKKLEEFDSDKLIVPQVIAEDGTAWNCWIDLNDIKGSGLVQLKIWHPDLKTLPKS